MRSWTSTAAPTVGRAGNRQRLVTFCLAAALRYQLTDAAEGVPPYGLVVLDEAFDKTDIHFTRAGLEVFRSFGFQACCWRHH